jgi:alkanesulfonate monooxygenase SsuD/methylene tetrahydromethanopterin reductase-like flavin-dependent oxidoreductase (luciferase family)
MRHGAFVPPFGDLADPNVIGELAVSAERAGWDGFFLWDHLQYRDPATHVLDPWIAMAVVADRTDRIRIGAMVTPLARRRPAIVARQLAALDLLSDGRIVLGAGLGLDASGRELSTFGEELDDRKRAAKLDEALEVVHALLLGELVEHAGLYYTVDGARFLPAPVQRPIPTWIGARWPNRAPLRRAARFEGVFVVDVSEPSEIVELRTFVEDLRGDSAFDVVVDLPPSSDPEPWEKAGVTWLLSRFSQFEADLSEVRDVIAAGPPRPR